MAPCAHTHISTQARTRRVQERDKEQRDIHLFAQRLPLALLLTSIFFSLLSPPTRVLHALALLPAHPRHPPPPQTLSCRLTLVRQQEVVYQPPFQKNTKTNLPRSTQRAAYFPRGFAPSRSGSAAEQRRLGKAMAPKDELYEGKRLYLTKLIHPVGTQMFCN